MAYLWQTEDIPFMIFFYVHDCGINRNLSCGACLRLRIFFIFFPFAFTLLKHFNSFVNIGSIDLFFFNLEEREKHKMIIRHNF